MELPRRRLPVAPLSLALVILMYFLFWPVPIDPVVWRPATNPRMAPNDGLSGIQTLPDVGPGPESIAIGRDGRLYTGLQDGRVVRLLANGGGVETFVQTGGLPFGMQFGAGGRLISADSLLRPPFRSPHSKITRPAPARNRGAHAFPK